MARGAAPVTQVRPRFIESGKWQEQRGFTLIELMLVIAIIAIISVTAVALSGPYLQKRQVETIAFQLMQDIRLVQSNAIFTRSYLRMDFSPAANTYSFQRPDLTTVTRTLNSVAGFPRAVLGSLTDGSSVFITTADQSPPGATSSLYFTPTGSPATDAMGSPVASAGARLTVASRAGYEIDVSVSSVLGMAHMTWH